MSFEISEDLHSIGKDIDLDIELYYIQETLDLVKNIDEIEYSLECLKKSDNANLEEVTSILKEFFMTAKDLKNARILWDLMLEENNGYEGFVDEHGNIHVKKNNLI
jgi:5'-deoxynucleotidase YfbR-like HD superfamily hydrolase